VKIDSETRSLLCAVDHQSEMLESYFTKRRDRKAALRFLRKPLKGRGRIENKVTDQRRSFSAALRELYIADHHERARWANNRAENLHQLFRRQERAAVAAPPTRERYRNSISVHASAFNQFIQCPLSFLSAQGFLQQCARLRNA